MKKPWWLSYPEIWIGAFIVVIGGGGMAWIALANGVGTCGP